MRKFLFSIIFLMTFLACKSGKKIIQESGNVSGDITIAFGSCNKTDIQNILWDDVYNSKPNMWIWGGDIVYADTTNMNVLREKYNALLNLPGYKNITDNIPVMGTWDDHDYGLNDGGDKFIKKRESQIELQNFLGVKPNDIIRKRDGVYTSEILSTDKGSVKIIVLDTRFFRTDLTKSNVPDRRYDPNPYGEGTMLGESQWQWLASQLNQSGADFHLIVSSIQFLSSEHGFESWGNFPHEVERLERLVVESKAKGAIILSGDRHIAEFSKKKMEGLDYPLIDFTSSGLTHVYSEFSGEKNRFRSGKVVNKLNYGLVKFDFDKSEVIMEIKGNNNETLEMLKQTY